ncbi:MULTISPECIES: PepSY domain-containing protein [Staphylococcus]|nr:PepSY domain-containing protein [Staphylococcus shinii]MEC5299787.1 PepSY domain-containing protein [Staphylococcus shinii]OEK90483.1 peptidase [Staphylococcus shinii]PTH96334.1 peptidase [Staphylococcus shinii]QRA17685.1 PepSY domain-containing protein [Staphylococcus shinii]RIM90415.1 peptidase [Staphylococcus shinii]
MKLKSLSVIVFSSLLLASCGNGSSDSDTKSENKKDTKSDNQVIAINKIKTSPEDAIKKAQQTYNNQHLKGISYEKSNGEWAYKIEQQGDNKESEVIISDKNKKILNKEQENEDSLNKNETFNYNNAIDYKEAIKKGQKEFDGDIKEWSLSKDDGKLVYDLDLKKDKEKHEVTIDAKNGKVLNNEQDN